MDDLALPQHHRSGAHRARRHPLLVLLVTLGTVGLASAVLLWALLSLDVLGVGDELRRAGGASSVAPADPSAAATPAATAVAPSPEPSVVPTTEPGQEPSASEEPSEEPEEVVDRSAPLDVLNSTSTTGLAAAAAAELEELGWTTGEVGNYGADEIDTTVLFPEDSLQATAEAVAEELGVGEVSASDDVDVVTVVLGPDYSA